MKINPIQPSFKSNVEIAQSPQAATVVTNPAVQNSSVPATASSYNVQVPLKYTALGVETLPYGLKAYLYKLENGQRVVIVPKEGSTIVKTYVNTGSMNEPDKVRGISHFIEHNLFNGSENLKPGEFFEQVNKMGASTNASTGFAATDYYISSHLLKKNDLEKQIKIHADMIENPKFAIDMIEKEKGPVTSEINMILDDPENIATNSTLKLLYNIDTTSKDIIGGTVDNINKITRDDVIDYYKKNYFPSNMITVVTGEVNPEQTIELISKSFKAKAVNPPVRKYEKLTPIEKSVRRDLISDKTDSTIISIGFNGPKNTDTRGKVLLDAIQFFLLGSSISRLNQSLDKINSNAFINSDRMSNKADDGRIILFSTKTSEENSEQVIKTILNEIASLEKNPPTDEEMKIVKKKLKLILAQVFENSNLVNANVGETMLDNDLDNITKFEGIIDKLTSKDLVDFAKQYFNMEKVAITAVHPASTNEKTIKENYSKTNKVSFTGNADEINHKEAINLSRVRKYNISNNFSVATYETNNDIAVMNLALSAPAPANIRAGVSEILSIMLNRGSGLKDEKTFFSQLERQGVSTNFSADENNIYVSSVFLPSDGVNALKAAKEVLLNPRFTQEELNYAKDVLKENLQSVQKTAGQGFLKEAFKGEIYGHTNEDILKNLDSIDMREVVALYNYIIDEAQGRVAISAPLQKNPQLKAAIFDELCKDFKTLKPANAKLFDGYVPVSEKKVVLQEHNKSQAGIQMGYKFKISGNLKDGASLILLNTILGGTPSSRLFLDLREKQKLAYQVNSNITNIDNSGVMWLFIKTTTDNQEEGKTSYDNLQKSIDGFNSHIKRLMNENVSDEELEAAKLHLKNSVLNGSELTGEKNSSILIGLGTPYGISLDNQLLEIIDSITPEDIKAAANYVFSTNPVTSVIATKNTLQYNKDYLKSLGTVVN